MFYFIKFLYTAVLLPPGIFILFLLALTIWAHRYNRLLGRMAAVTTLLLYLCSTSLVSGALLRPLESSYQPPEQPSGDVIIMLGGGATLDTPNFGSKGHLSGFAANRLLTAAQLHEKLKVPIILSGGRVFATTGREAEIAREILLRLGVPDEQIILEDNSVNTTENAKFTGKILSQYSYSRPILVTSAFHMPRAMGQFAKAGVQPTPFPTDYQVNCTAHIGFSSLWPDAGALENVSLAVKEYVGLLALRWY